MSVKSVYDHEAAAYDSRYKMPIHAVEDMIVEAAIRTIYAPGMTVIDAGCGTGHAIKMIDFPKEEYRGLDPSEGMLEVARKKHPDHQFVNVTFEDYYAVPPVDVVLAIYGQVNYMGLEAFRRGLDRNCSGRFLAVLYSGVSNPDCEYTADHQKIYSASDILDYFAGTKWSVETYGLSKITAKNHGSVIRMLKYQASETGMVLYESDCKQYKYIMVMGTRYID